MKRNARILSLLLLASVNLLLIVLAHAMLGLPGDRGFYHQLYFRAMISLANGVPNSVLLLLACYGALSETRLNARMLVLVSGAGLVLAAFYFGGTLIPGETIAAIPGHFKSLLGPAICLFVGLLPLRQVLGWRIVWLPCDSPPSRQRSFRVLHLWAWMAAIAIPLGVTQSIYGSRTGIILLMALKELVGLLFVFVPCLWLAGTARSRRFWVPAIIGLAAVFAGCEGAISLAIHFAMKGPPLAWLHYLFQFEAPLLYNLAVAGILLGNLLWLESLGLRFVRPGAAAQMALEPA